MVIKNETMKTNFTLNFILWAFISLPTFLNAQQSNEINYFNSPPPPADSVVVFARDIVSLKDRWEEKICFTSDGKEAFFGRHHDADPNKNYFRPRVMHSTYLNNKWSVPDTASFSRKTIVGYPLLSLNGTLLLMEQPIKHKKNGATGRIVFSKKENGKWLELDSIIPNVASKQGFGLAQITNDSTFYFHDRFDRIAYSSKIVNGKYSKPKPLPYRINPIVEFFVSPSNDYIIFEPINWSNQLHISFRNSKNKWSMPLPLSKYFEEKKGWNCKGISPYVSPDGKYFFFGKNGDIYWVKTNFIESLRKRSQL